MKVSDRLTELTPRRCELVKHDAMAGQGRRQRPDDHVNYSQILQPVKLNFEKSLNLNSIALALSLEKPGASPPSSSCFL